MDNPLAKFAGAGFIGHSQNRRDGGNANLAVEF